jgi:hypothetical protein
MFFSHMLQHLDVFIVLWQVVIYWETRYLLLLFIVSQSGPMSFPHTLSFWFLDNQMAQDLCQLILLPDASQNVWRTYNAFWRLFNVLFKNKNVSSTNN